MRTDESAICARSVPGVKDLVHRLWALRKQVVDEIVAMFPRTALLNRNSRHWPKLRLPGGPIVWVLVCQATTTPVGHPRWILPCRTKRTPMSLVCRCDGANATIRDYHLIPRIKVGGRQTLRECDPVLLAGERDSQSPRSFAESEDHGSGLTLASTTKLQPNRW